MSISVLSVKEVSRNWGELVLFDQISFDIEVGKKTALVARNGTGKTTLLETIAGNQTPDAGTIEILKDHTLGYLPQEPQFDETLTVIEALFSKSIEVSKAIEAYEKALEDTTSGDFQKAYDEMDRLNAWSYESRMKEVLGKLNLTRLDQKVSVLSGGQKKRLALAAILIEQPDLLILDEPTNHLDLKMIEWLEEYLKRFTGALLMITHDRYFLDRVCNEIFELDFGNIYTYKGNFSYFLEKREERIQNMIAEKEKAQNLLRKEQEWMRRMPKARGTKAKYRIDAFHDLKKKAKVNINSTDVKIQSGTARLGKKILNLIGISKAYDDLVLLDDFNYNFARGEKVGIIGENGTGKSTFLNVITESTPADSGEIEKGETIQYGYFRQDMMKLDENKTVLEVITDISEKIVLGKDHVISPLQFLTHFLFEPAMHSLKVEKLSGGEKRRLYLMTVLMKNPNFLILDEPTNDLDIQTLNVLEDYLENYPGCVIIVTHDRFFMDRVVNHLFVFEGKGVIKDFAGNYTQYREAVQQIERDSKMEEREKKKAEEKPKEKVRKLTYKERLELEALSEEIEKLETEKFELEDSLNVSGINADVLAKTTERLSELGDLLDEKEMRWLELSELDE